MFIHRSVSSFRKNILLVIVKQKTSPIMGIDNSDCLQIGINDGRTHELHPTFLQIYGNLVG